MNEARLERQACAARIEASSPPAGWLDALRRRIEPGTAPHGIALVLPTYRPDLVHFAADGLGLEYRDFRREVMAVAGGDPARLPLELIDELASAPGGGGLILQNVEALLATKSVEVRRAWLKGFIGVPKERPVVLPIVLFADDLPGCPAVISVPGDELPADSLMMRLWANR